MTTYDKLPLKRQVSYLHKSLPREGQALYAAFGCQTVIAC